MIGFLVIITNIPQIIAINEIKSNISVLKPLLYVSVRIYKLFIKLKNRNFSFQY